MSQLYTIFTKVYFISSDKNEMRPEDFEITLYEWNQGKLDVFESVDLSYRDLIKLPFNFGTIHGHFNCAGNRLISLEGSPSRVKGSFYCSMNQLISLKGGPVEIDGNFQCSDNYLKTLEGCPDIIQKHFYCNDNEINSLLYFPSKIGFDFNCSNNKIKDLSFNKKKPLPLVFGLFFCYNNPIETIDEKCSIFKLKSELSKEQFSKMIMIRKNKNKIKEKMNMF